MGGYRSGHVTGKAFVPGEVSTLCYCVSTSTDEGVTQCYRTKRGRDGADA